MGPDGCPRIGVLCTVYTYSNFIFVKMSISVLKKSRKYSVVKACLYERRDGTFDETG